MMNYYLDKKYHLEVTWKEKKILGIKCWIAGLFSIFIRLITKPLKIFGYTLMICAGKFNMKEYFNCLYSGTPTEE